MVVGGVMLFLDLVLYCVVVGVVVVIFDSPYFVSQIGFPCFRFYLCVSSSVLSLS